MKNERLEELRTELAEEMKREAERIEANPLSQYSTTELKRELRRRKGR